MLKKLLAEFDSLLKRVVDLGTESERLTQDQKTNQAEKKRGQHGPPFGHQQFSHPLVENPDRVFSSGRRV